MIQSCSITNLFGGSNEQANNETQSIKSLCTSKQNIVANHSYVSSLKACRELSNQGDMNATYTLGLLYTDQNILTSFLDPNTRVNEGINYITKAADSGVVKAQVALADYYAETNLDKSIYYNQLAVNQGDTGAMLNLASIYENQKQCKKALDLYQKEIQKNKPNAHGYFYSAILYESGCQDLPQNMPKACSYLRVAQNTSLNTTINQVMMYERENGTYTQHDSITATVNRIKNFDQNNRAVCEQGYQNLINNK